VRTGRSRVCSEGFGAFFQKRTGIKRFFLKKEGKTFGFSVDSTASDASLMQVVIDEPATIFVCLLGYLLGSIPFGLLLTKFAGLGDLRGIGSGNIGATNVLRTGRKELAAATLVLDGVKGLAAVLLARALVDNPDSALFAGLAAVLGHLFPVWLRFNGGKGVATGLGVLIAAAWPIGLSACAVWLLVAGTMRLSSLASLAAFTIAPCVGLILEDFSVVKLAFTIAVLVFVRHQANIRRLLAGTEPRIGRNKTERA
jgi:glycerol-3-phosphate acyltransferase PlsY